MERLYVYCITADSEGEMPKKKAKATPLKKSTGKSKGGKSPATPVVKKEIKSPSDFFGMAPVKRSSYFKKSSSAAEKKVS